MIETREAQLSDLLEKIAELIDIPEEMYLKAVAIYSSVGDWLCVPDSPLAKYTPHFYSQGSVRLGTVSRPITNRDEYDLDSVCRLEIAKERISQKELKALIGDRLKAHAVFRELLIEGRRCWTLDYRGNFHVDVLPAIPDSDGRPESILITDRDLHRWQHSNPIGYARWFEERMLVQLLERRLMLAKALDVNVEDVPEWKVKTPLQRVVQLLKRHRDLRFQDDPEDKPISIIITTLAARVYDNTPDLLESLVEIVKGMRDHIQKRDGVYWVPNPVNPDENFADKWAQYPQRAQKFFAWLDKLEADLEEVMQSAGLHKLGKLFGEMFGETTASEALKAFGLNLHEQRTQGQLRMAAGTGTLGSTGTVVRDHNFHGEVADSEA